jgi:hypothetical protein
MLTQMYVRLVIIVVSIAPIILRLAALLVTAPQTGSLIHIHAPALQRNQYMQFM